MALVMSSGLYVVLGVVNFLSNSISTTASWAALERGRSAIVAEPKVDFCASVATVRAAFVRRDGTKCGSLAQGSFVRVIGLTRGRLDSSSGIVLNFVLVSTTTGRRGVIYIGDLTPIVPTGLLVRICDREDQKSIDAKVIRQLTATGGKQIVVQLGSGERKTVPLNTLFDSAGLPLVVFRDPLSGKLL